MKQPPPKLLQRFHEALFGAPRADGPDPADMGTAWGMECSLAVREDDVDAHDEAQLGLALSQAPPHLL